MNNLALKESKFTVEPLCTNIAHISIYRRLPWSQTHQTLCNPLQYLLVMGTSLYRQFPWTQRRSQASYNQPFLWHGPLAINGNGDTLVSSIVWIKEVWALCVWVSRGLNNWGSSNCRCRRKCRGNQQEKSAQASSSVLKFESELTRGGSCLILRKVAHRETALSKKETKDITTPSCWDLCILMTISNKKKLGLICTCVTVTLFFC